MRKVFLFFIFACLCCGCTAKSPYYKSFDFYNTSPSQTLIKLDKFPTHQQVYEDSCGAAALYMALKYFDINADEKDLYQKIENLKARTAGYKNFKGTPTFALEKTAQSFGLKTQSSVGVNGYYFKSEKEFAEYIKEALLNNRVVITDNVEWGGHWMVLIGYDDMGTEEFDDDVLIFADPYDTTDHFKDGYTIKSFQRYFAEWRNFDTSEKQDYIQQFVTVSL